MTLTAAAWTARIAAALCSASRWLAAGSLGLTVCALVTAPLVTGAAFAATAFSAALGGVQLYLAVRIEFDRAIFVAAAQDGFEGFDQALERLGWRGPNTERSPEQRAAGLVSLVKRSGALLVAQLALLLAALWLLR